MKIHTNTLPPEAGTVAAASNDQQDAPLLKSSLKTTFNNSAQLPSKTKIQFSEEVKQDFIESFGGKRRQKPSKTELHLGDSPTKKTPAQRAQNEVHQHKAETRSADHQAETKLYGEYLLAQKNAAADPNNLTAKRALCDIGLQLAQLNITTTEKEILTIKVIGQEMASAHEFIEMDNRCGNKGAALVQQLENSRSEMRLWQEYRSVVGQAQFAADKLNNLAKQATANPNRAEQRELAQAKYDAALANLEVSKAELNLAKEQLTPAANYALDLAQVDGLSVDGIIQRLEKQKGYGERVGITLDNLAKYEEMFGLDDQTPLREMMNALALHANDPEIENCYQELRWVQTKFAISTEASLGEVHTQLNHFYLIHSPNFENAITQLTEHNIPVEQARQTRNLALELANQAAADLRQKTQP